MIYYAAMKTFLPVGVLTACLSMTTGASAFAPEWLTASGSARARLTAALESSGRTTDATFLRAAWAGDADTAIAAGRTLLAQEWNELLADGLRRLLTQLGKTDEAAALVPPPRPRARAATALLSNAAPDLSGRRPIVFLHGYSGDAETWKDFTAAFRKAGYGADDLLVFEYYAKDAGSGLPEGLTSLDADVNTPIETIADEVARRTRVWLRRRAGLPDDSSEDADLPAPDWICHSMGGLVFRCLLATDADLVHRCVDLGTPHFGQAIGANGIIALLTGDQTKQMAYGSSFLWNLAADWHYRGRRTDDILFIVGAGTSDKILDNETELVQDALVDAFSATMLTFQDGAAFSNRTYFVHRVHSSVFRDAYGYPGLPELPKGTNDPVFKLSFGYLNDSHYFANGAAPTQAEILLEDGASDVRVSKVMRKVREHGALFVQVMHAQTNSTEATDSPVVYKSSDEVVHWIKQGETKYRDGESGTLPMLWGHGCDGEGCRKGLALLYGALPTGDVTVRIWESGKESDLEPYTAATTIYGGGTTLFRARPGHAKPVTATALADDRGRVRMLVVPNDWLSAHGAAASEEDLSGCVAAAAAAGANGCPRALSWLLGLSPDDPSDAVRLASIAVDGQSVDLRLTAGARFLRPGVDPFVLQGCESLGSAWHDITPQMGTVERIPLSDDRFFRAVLRW